MKKAENRFEINFQALHVGKIKREVRSGFVFHRHMKINIKSNGKSLSAGLPLQHSFDESRLSSSQRRAVMSVPIKQFSSINEKKKLSLCQHQLVSLSRFYFY